MALTELEKVQIVLSPIGVGVIEILRPGTARELAAKPAQAFRLLLRQAGQARRVVVSQAKITKAILQQFPGKIPPLVGKSTIATTGVIRRVKLARLTAIGARAKVAALPALPIEIALIIIGQTEPGEMLFKEIKRQVLKIRSDDPAESLEGVLALSLLILGTTQVAVIAAGFAVGFTPAAAPVALSIGAGILLEVAIA